MKTDKEEILTEEEILTFLNINKGKAFTSKQIMEGIKAAKRKG